MKKANYDFSGMATAYGVLCGDGRVIKHGAFDHQTGNRVPLVWRHQHSKLDNVLGHAVLYKSDSPSGIRAEAKFNNTADGERAKVLVHNGDITALSVYANQLDERINKEDGTREVLYGTIRELSLVLAGANPGAYIDDVVLHGDDGRYVEESSAYITSGMTIAVPITIATEPVEADVKHDAITESIEEKEPMFEHEGGEETIKDILNGMNDQQKTLLAGFLAHAAGEVPEGTGSVNKKDQMAVERIWASMSEKQQIAVSYIYEQFKNEMADAAHDDFDDDYYEGEDDMSENIFANGAGGGNRTAAMKHSADEINALLQTTG